jgi:hypothetical protein
MEVVAAMPKRIDTAVDEEKAAAPQPVLDQPPAETGLEQLPSGNYAVLSLGQGEDQPGRLVTRGMRYIRSATYFVVDLMGQGWQAGHR